MKPSLSEWTMSYLRDTLDVKFCKDHREGKTEVPDTLAVEDLMSSKLNNKDQ